MTGKSRVHSGVTVQLQSGVAGKAPPH